MPSTLRGSYRLLRVVLYLFYGLWLTLRHGAGPGGERRLIAIRRHWYRRALELSGVEVRCHGQRSAGPALVVANHVSWLDIPVLGSVLDVRFLSKVEVGRWPVIGLLARRNGTLFIHRGAHHTERIVKDIADVLGQGRQVVIFPEATTTGGGEVRRFHPRLFAAAVDTGTPVQPVALDYGRGDGDAPSVAAFFGGEWFVRHAWRILRQPRTVVHVHILPALPVREGATRRELADTARRAVLTTLGLPESREARVPGADR